MALPLPKPGTKGTITAGTNKGHLQAADPARTRPKALHKPRTIPTSTGLLLHVAPTGHLRLPPHPEPCHGYQNACVCAECVERERNAGSPPNHPRQPWEPRPRQEAA